MNFQMTGLTDSDTIASLGRGLNADYVISGHIRRLGNSNLIIVTIINVETFEQLADDYHVYSKIEEVRDLLPDISRKLITAIHKNTKLPKLAIVPFNINANTGANVQDAETLAQILSVEVANTGRYSVLPRTTTMQSAIRELEYQMSGYTADEGAKALGRAINAEYVLSAEVRRFGTYNMLTAQILHVEDGHQLSGASQDYLIIDDGINLIKELAIRLLDPDNAEILIAALNRQRTRANIFNDPARFWSLGISAGSSFSTPWVIGSIHGTIAPFKYSFLEIGIDYGMVSKNIDTEKYYSIYPFIHYALFIPFQKNIGWYTGIGGGYMLGEYTFPEEKIPLNIFAFDAIMGVNIWDMLNISYTLRTGLKTINNQISLNNKVTIGYTYRFKQRGK